MTNYGHIAGIAAFFNHICEYMLTEFRWVSTSDLKSYGRDFGFVYLGAGAYRVTFTHPSCPGVVFKVCFSQNQEEAEALTRSEYNFYHNKATSTDKKYIAECYYTDRRVSVMREVQGRSGTKSAKENFHKFTGHKKLWEYDDADTYNIKILDDETPILFDYAVNL